MKKHTCDLCLRGGMLVHHDRMERGDIAIDQGRIIIVGDCQDVSPAKEIDCKYWHLFPGLIDTHVHFREPGGEAKEDWEHGSRSALLGGITTICDMPNTDPATVSEALFNSKLNSAANRMYVDYGFWMGAHRDHLAETSAMTRRRGLAGIKVYMAETTGDLLFDSDAIEDLLGQSQCIVAFHAEDQERLQMRAVDHRTSDVASHSIWRDAETAARAIRRISSWCRRKNTKAYILHVSSRRELKEIAKSRKHIVCEATPHHLTLSAPESYRRMGTKVQVNPPLRSEDDRRALIEALRNGLVDTIGSDHAPHRLEEKAIPYPNSPSGFPGCQTLLPLMLDLFWREEIPLTRLASAAATRPAELLALQDRGRLEAGYIANITVVDTNRIVEIKDADMASRCGWTPYAGMHLRGCPVMTILHGCPVMREGDITEPSSGQAIA